MTQPTWQTAAGSLGGYPSGIALNIQLLAIPVLPAVSVTYSLLSGTLHSGLALSALGLISGTPTATASDASYTFAVRATDNLGNIRDRTFSIMLSGVAAPYFTTLPGEIMTTSDSLWIELRIEYVNPLPDAPAIIRLVQGRLPPGLEINEAGLIRGYPAPPITTVNLGSLSTVASDTSSLTNGITCFSTTGFSANRPVTFAGTALGGIDLSHTYYIKEITGATTFTISESQDGSTFALSTSTGIMDITLLDISVGEPAIITYSFTLRLESPLGDDQESYQIVVQNQNTPISQGGPGKAPHSRDPVIFNTMPPTYAIETSPDFRYYVLPPNDEYGVGGTYPPTSFAFIGEMNSDNFFAFKMLGHDFDTDELTYAFQGLPSSLTGDSTTGWITGTPTVNDNIISEFSFQAQVFKKDAIEFHSATLHFSFRLTNNINGDIVWITPPDLGTMFNGTVSTMRIDAISGVSLQYALESGTLPPNLILQSDGEITGKVAFQPTNRLLSADDSTEFTFTVKAAATDFASVVNSTRTFTVTIEQHFAQPVETLLIRAAPPISGRILLDSLLSSDVLIPPDMIYRPNDSSFGKATNVTFPHAYGIYASSLEEYIAATTKNHYWRALTLGELSTAIARDAQGEIIYEVVYSNVIDNLINPVGTSIPEEIVWPRDIDLHLGPWYASSTEIFTSWIWNEVTVSNMLTETDLEILTENYLVLETEQGLPTYFTSLTSGTARILYPNSLPNMTQRVGTDLGITYDSKLLPLWMTSQQHNGSTIGFIPAWVICYTKPGFSETIKNNIEQNWKDELGRVYALNMIDFQIDRFMVDKSTTYNYDNRLHDIVTGQGGSWTELPSATLPNPPDSKNFYVLFPRKTILPSQTQ